MNIKKFRVGLLFLILALIVVQGASAAHPMKAAPTSNTGVISCEGCHDGAGGGGGFVCTDCHVYPTFYLSLKAAPTSIPALSSSDVTLTVGKNNTVRDAGYNGLIPVFSPASGATVTLSGAGVSTSGTTASTGIVTETVNPTVTGTINADAALTGFNNGAATVSVTTAVVVPVLTTITVSPATANLLTGATQTFTAAPKDQNGNAIVVAITWTSSNTTVGNVDASGNFTASAAGTTTIKAANGTVNGTATVTVTATAPTPVLTTITVSPATANLVVGTTQVFAAAPKDQNGNPIVAAITWTSSNTTVGNVDASGNFTASAAGTATIKAANGTVNGTATVTVTATAPTPVLTTITVSPATANLVVGTTQVFAAAPKDQNGNPIVAAITWTSSNTTVGNVDASGNFTASAAGTATIKAANGTVNGTATVTVTVPAPTPVLTTITVSPSTANIVVGATQVFAAAPKDQNSNAIVAAITWTSSNATVGNVDANGKFTASAAGTTTIKAANGTVNGTATVTVTVPTPSSYYIVTFIVTDNVTGKPIKEAKVSIDGVKHKQKTNRSGIVVFKKVSPGNHTYKIQKEHYKMVKGSIEVGANMTVSVKLVLIKEKHDKKDDKKDNETDETDHDNESDEEDD